MLRLVTRNSAQEIVLNDFMRLRIRYLIVKTIETPVIYRMTEWPVMLGR
ncbi:MAG: hypothetical protein ACXVIB_03615 [Halobacteriota archaeon]